MTISPASPLPTPPEDRQHTSLIANLTDRLSSVGHALIGLGQGEARFREVIEALPVAIYTTDEDGRLTFYNEAAAALWGCQPALRDSRWCGSWKLFKPDGTPLAHEDCPMAIALRTGQSPRGVEAIAERPDGSRVPFAPYPTPIFDASGKLVGAVNLLVDLTDRKRSEVTAQRLALIVESSEDAIVSKDLTGMIISWNRGAERLFGYSSAEAVGNSITMLIPSDQLSEEVSILDRIKRGIRIEHYETVRRRKDGSLVDISLSVSPIRDGEGRIIGASKIARDITDRKRAQEQQKLLLAEIMHRVKNTLATVQAIATQTMSGTAPSELGTFIGRLHALGRAHDLLITDKWDRAPLRRIVMSAVAPFQEQRFAVKGEDTWLTASKALQLTLALHELSTNAVKHGALSREDGRIRIAWRLLADGRIRLRWQESGGPVVSAPRHKGFGSTLIQHTFEGARLEYAPSGFICVVTFTP